LPATGNASFFAATCLYNFLPLLVSSQAAFMKHKQSAINYQINLKACDDTSFGSHANYILNIM
jgi:hypothetical protein